MKRIIYVWLSLLCVIALNDSVMAAVGDGVPSNCAMSSDEMNKIAKGIQKIQSVAGKNVKLNTRFVTEDRKEFFQVTTNGGLGVRSSQGNFPAMICATPNGITAHLHLNIAQKVIAKRSEVKVTVRPVASNTVRIDSDLDGDEATNFIAL